MYALPLCDIARRKKNVIYERYAILRTNIELDSTMLKDTKVSLLKELDTVRSKCKVSPKPRTFLEMVSATFRFLLFTITMLGICLVLCTFSPLRWTHPFLRRFASVRNGDLPMDLLFRFSARAALAAAGIKATRLHSTRPRVGSSWGEHQYGIIVANHCSNLDPMVLTLASPHIPKYVGKRSLFLIPIFGWALLAIGFVPINRGNRAKAIEALNSAVHRIMLRFGRSVGLFVEGTRCRDGNLILPFKKGAFHMQRQTKAPLLPAVLDGTYELWPSSHFFCRTGRVVVRIMPPLRYDASSSVNDTRLKLQRIMINEIYRKKDNLEIVPLNWSDVLENILILASFFMILALVLGGWACVVSYSGFCTQSILSGAVCFSCVVTGYIYFVM